MKRCPKCRKRLWVLRTRIVTDDGKPMTAYWDTCEAGCYLDPPETATIIVTVDAAFGDCEPCEVYIGFDEFGRSRIERDKQAKCLERAQWLAEFRDLCLRWFCEDRDHRHIRRARRVETSRRDYVKARVRPERDLDELVLPLTSTEQLAWGKVRVLWTRLGPAVGAAHGKHEESTSFYDTDHLVQALDSHAKSGVPVTVGRRSQAAPSGSEREGASLSLGEAFGGKAGA